MSESPAEALRRAAESRRRWADGPYIRKHAKPTVRAAARLLEAIAADMDRFPTEERPDGVGYEMNGRFGASAVWTDALALARGYLGEPDGGA